MKKIVITGNKGVVGTAISGRLRDVAITPLDLPEYDVRDPVVLDGILRPTSS